MERKNKNAFLILRVEESFKEKVVSKATELGETVSEFIRRIVSGKL